MIRLFKLACLAFALPVIGLVILVTQQPEQPFDDLPDGLYYDENDPGTENVVIPRHDELAAGYAWN